MEDSESPLLVSPPGCSKLERLKNALEKVVTEIVKRDMERLEDLKRLVETLEDSSSVGNTNRTSAD